MARGMGGMNWNYGGWWGRVRRVYRVKNGCCRISRLSAVKVYFKVFSKKNNKKLVLLSLTVMTQVKLTVNQVSLNRLY